MKSDWIEIKQRGKKKKKTLTGQDRKSSGLCKPLVCERVCVCLLTIVFAAVLFFGGLRGVVVIGAVAERHRIVRTFVSQSLAQPLILFFCSMEKNIQHINHSRIRVPSKTRLVTQCWKSLANYLNHTTPKTT